MNAKPIFKWPGGKRRLLSHILPLMNVEYNKYYEPFLGGGAVFFAMGIKTATISDNNKELINCYIQVKNNPEAVIHELSSMTNSEEYYYKIRNWNPRKKTRRAARLIYLVTLSFNGIYRENLKGRFNVPYGKKTHVHPCNPSRLLQASKQLEKAEIRCCDFDRVIDDVGKNDLLYIDPPYTVAHGENGFIKYNALLFTWEDQQRLATSAKLAWARGAHVVISNANHPSIRELYSDFNCAIIQRHSVMAASSEKRCRISECVFYSDMK